MKVQPLLILLVFSASLYAQDQSTMSGKFGMQFRMNANNLTSLQNGVGCRYWLKDNLSTNLLLTYSDRNETREGREDQTDQVIKESEWISAIELAYHFRQTKKISPFAGAMFSLSFPKGKVKYSTSVDSDKNERITEQTRYEYGIFIGFEYTLSDHFSLAAVQSFSIMSRNSEQEEYYAGQKQLYKTTESRNRLGDISVMLNYYF